MSNDRLIMAAIMLAQSANPIRANCRRRTIFSKKNKTKNLHASNWHALFATNSTVLLNLLLIVTAFVGRTSPQDQSQQINEKAKNPLEDPNEIPPSIYQWIDENAHICTTVPHNGQSTINFLSVEDGSRCVLCPELRAGEVPKVACAVEIRPNQLDLDIGCHQIPELCVLELHERYAEFFAAGGKIPKVSQSVASLAVSQQQQQTTQQQQQQTTTQEQQQQSSNEIFEVTADPFVESNTVGEDFLSTQTITTQSTTTVRADQFTPDAGSAVSVNISTSDFAAAATKMARPLGRIVPPPAKRAGRRKTVNEREDDKNADDRDLKAAVCRDTHELCCFWANAGECDQNPFWMRINCAKTCGTCNCKVRNANKCVSTGVECQTTTTSSTTSSTSSTSTSTRSSSSATSPTTVVVTTSRGGRIRTMPPGFKTRPRNNSRPRRPPSSTGGANRPPGHRPQRPLSTVGDRPQSTVPSTSPTAATVGKHISTVEEDPDYFDPNDHDRSGSGGGSGGDGDGDGDGDGNGDGRNIIDSSSSDGNGGDHGDGGGNGNGINDFNAKGDGVTVGTFGSNDYGDDPTVVLGGKTTNANANTGKQAGNGDERENNGTDDGGGGGGDSRKSTNADASSSSSTRVATTTRATCFNFNRLCRFWAELGECEQNPFWMRPHCQKACNSCGETVESVFQPQQSDECNNQHTFCPFWAFIGECARNARWMLTNCRASCQLC